MIITRSSRAAKLSGLAVLIFAGAVGALVAQPGGLRLAVAAAGLLLVFVALQVPRSVVVGLIVWLVALGTVRRIASGVSPKEAYGDPLLLVGAAAWVTLGVAATRRGAFARRSRLTNAVLSLGAVLLLSAFNPLQGGLTVGLSGALLVVVPMAAFLVGRALVDERLLGQLLRIAAWLGVSVALYGLYQTFTGFPPWDATWIKNEGYEALNVGGTIRPFASFSAASEYAGFLGIAVVIWVARARSAVRWPVAAVALGLLGAALWYEAARGATVLTVAAVALVLTARAGLPLGRSLLVGACGLLILPVVISQLAPGQFSDGAGDRLAEHQVAGLSDPFGEDSTLPEHIDRVALGIVGAVRDPLGIGVGATTTSGDKFGGTTATTEADPGNVAVATGFPGLVAYLAVVVVGVPRAYRLAAQRRDATSLAALGIVAVTSLQWLNGGHYAVAFWPWLVLGWVDVAYARLPIKGTSEHTADEQDRARAVSLARQDRGRSRCEDEGTKEDSTSVGSNTPPAVGARSRLTHGS